MVYADLKQYTLNAHKYDKNEQDRSYFAEVRDINDRINEVKTSKGKDLLDIGCGTGTHLVYLQKKYNCTGFDLHQEMLNIAKKKLNDKVKLFQNNMLTFNLNKKFDVIISLYSVINYAKNFNEFKQILQNIYNHLRKGGVCLIEPFYTKFVFEHDRNKSYPESLLVHEIDVWTKIMKEIGFKVKYNYSGLNQKAKGLYILIK